MVNPRLYDGQSFENPNLKSVAFEIRFPSNVRIIKEHHKYQEQINEQFPKYGEGITYSGIPDELIPPETMRMISYINEDTGDTVKIALDKFIFVKSKEYGNYLDFKTNIMDLFQKFQETFSIKTCRRIGLRYTNFMEFSQELEQSRDKYLTYFHPFHDQEKFPSDQLFLHNIEIRKFMQNDVILSYRSQFQINNTTKKYFHILDFDSYIVGQLPIEECDVKLDLIHNIERDGFLLSVTDDFMDSIGVSPNIEEGGDI